MASGREWKDTYTIEALLTGDASRLKKAVDRAKAILKKLEDDDGEVQIKGDSAPLQKSIRVAKAQLNTLKNSSASIDIDGNNEPLKRDIDESSKMIDALKKKASVIEMNAVGLERLKELQSIKVSSVDFDGEKVNIAPEFNTKVAESKISRFKSLLRSIPNRIRTKMDVDVDFDHRGIITRLGDVTDEFQRNMAKMARSIQSFAVVLGNQVKGGLLASLPALVPIVASLVPAVMALGNAIGVVGGGLIGLAGAFGVAGVAGLGFGGMVASVLARYNSDAFQATKESDKFTQAIERIKSTWNGIVDTNMASIFTTMTNAINGANNALGQMTPMFSGVAGVMEQASVKFQKFIDQSPIAERFFNMMNTTGVSVFETLLSAVGKFGAGFMQVFNLMEPLMVNMANGFQNLGQRFLEWSQKVGTEKNFQKFADYVQQALPLIGSIFGSTFQGIINLFASFGDNSLVIFETLAQMAERFKTWSSTIKESDGFQKFIQYVQEHGGTVISLIGNVIMVIVNLGIALADFGAVVLNVIDRIAEFTAELLKNHPIVGQIAGALVVLGGAFMMLLPFVIQGIAIFHQFITPLIKAYKQGTLLSTAVAVLKSAFMTLVGTVGTIIGVLALLVGSFMLLWETNEGFRTRVIEIWNQIKEHISNAVTAVKTFVQEIWGSLVEWWNQNNQNILEVVATVWSAILDTVQAVMTFLVPIVKVAWESIKTIISVALDLILGIVGVFFAVLNGDWSGAWEIIKSTALSIWEAITSGIDNVMAILTGLIGTNMEEVKNKVIQGWEAIKTRTELVWATFKTIISTAWESIKATTSAVLIALGVTIKSAWTSIKTTVSSIMTAVGVTIKTGWESIKSTVSAVMTAIGTAIKVGWNSIKSTVSAVMTAVGTAIKTGWNSIKSFVSSVMTALGATIKTAWNSIKSTISSVLNAIKSTVTSVWNSIKSAISSALNSIKSTTSSIWNSIKSVITSVLNGIKAGVTSAWNAIKSVITSVMSTIKSLITSAWNAIKSVITSVVNAIRNIISTTWNNIRNTVSSVSNSIKNTVSRIFNALKGIVTRAFNAVKSAVSNGMQQAYNTVTSFFGRFRTAGSNIVSNIASGIRGAIGKVTSAISSVTQRVRDFLPFSPAKRGALRDIMKVKIAGSIAENIKRTRNLPIRQMSRMTSGMKKVIDRFNPEVTPEFTGFNSGIRRAQMSARASLNHNIETQMEAPNMTIETNLHLGDRQYKGFVNDISKQQRSETQLEESYDM